jgi:16S rRNA (cytidine1402-2'-O)-methyltransferase
MSGILYLVPVPIGDGDPKDELAPRVVHIVNGIRDFIVENERSARRVLSRMMPQAALDASTLTILDEHTRPEALASLLAPLIAGRNAAIVSEAGSPCVADPGAALVAAASRAGIRSVPLPGPSSILMAIMATGLGGQRFAFRGYLPPDNAGREAALRELETRSAHEGSTQVFIETPYRNDSMTQSAARVLGSDTIFCAAIGLSSAEERIVRMDAATWRKATPVIGKIPTVFLLLAAAGYIPAIPERPLQRATENPANRSGNRRVLDSRSSDRHRPAGKSDARKQPKNPIPRPKPRRDA